MSPTTPHKPAAGPQSIRRVAIASLTGTALEWYDFFLYGTAAALVFGTLFFPEASPLAGTLASFGTFAVGFAARPLGGIIFGHFGDRLGRKPMLVITLLIMGFTTFLIGTLPTYAQIGVWAPILLTLLRILQGIAVGGEWGGSVLSAFPFFWLLDTGTPVLVWLAFIIVIGIGHGAMIGTQPSFFTELFGKSSRYSAISLGHELASVFAGGLSPLIATALLAATDSSWPISVYIILLGSITLVSVYLARETVQRDTASTPDPRLRSAGTHE